MITEQANCFKKTVITNNEEETKRNVLSFNPNSIVLEAKWAYKYF